ncbi:MAG: hypothetical protein WBV82_10860 [Myxococcaceae bacterium]
MAAWIPIAWLLAQAGEPQVPPAPDGPAEQVEQAPGPEVQEPTDGFGGEPGADVQAPDQTRDEQLEALTEELRSVREELQTQNQQVQELQQQLQTQGEAVTHLEAFDATEVERREDKELSREDRVAQVETAVDAVRSARLAVNQGQQDVTGQLDEAASFLDAAAATARSWGENEQAELLTQSRALLAQVPAYLDERNFWQAKVALYGAELTADSALNVAQAVELPEQ